MRTTLNLDGDLIDGARWLTGIEEKTALVHAALKTLVERESAAAGCTGRDDAQTAADPKKAAASRQVTVLVDTSVWIAHFRRSDPRLQALLSDGELLMHPAVIGELACGNLKCREEVLADLQQLPFSAAADGQDTMFVIESRSFGEKELVGPMPNWWRQHCYPGASFGRTIRSSVRWHAGYA